MIQIKKNKARSKNEIKYNLAFRKKYKTRNKIKTENHSCAVHDTLLTNTLNSTVQHITTTRETSTSLKSKSNV